MTNGKRVYRMAPCPSYDVEGMEKWLSDLAETGLFLVKDGFFAGAAAFERREPCQVKYRLEASQNPAGIWADNGGEPDPEQVELSRRYAWEYVAKRGYFYIYRSQDMEARELNTDPAVQALALNAVKQRQRSTAVYLSFWLVVYPLLLQKGGLLLTVIHMRTWLFLLTAVFVIWMVTDEILAFLTLRRFQKRLREDGALRSNKDWQKGAASYQGKRLVKLVMGIVLLCVILTRWSDSVLDKNLLPISQYTGDLPFAVMTELADAEVTAYRDTMSGMSSSINTLREYADILAPRCIEYNEHAALTLSDGRQITGGYEADYYETQSPLLAQWLAGELYRADSLDRLFFSAPNFRLLESPTLEVPCDTLYVYQSTLRFPTAVIQRGNRVIRVEFFQTSDDTLPMEEWVSAVAESLG